MLELRVSAVARWFVLSIITVCALVVGLAAPVDAARAEDDPDPATTSAPALPAEPAPVVEPSVPQGEFAPVEPVTPAEEPVSPEPVTPAPEVAEVDRSGLEVVSRSEFETEYVNDAGAGVAQISVDPLNVRVDGDWVEVDPNLAAVEGGWEAERHPLSPEFAETAEGDDAVVVQRDGHEVALSLVGADAGTAEAPFWFGTSGVSSRTGTCFPTLTLSTPSPLVR